MVCRYSNGKPAIQVWKSGKLAEQLPVKLYSLVADLTCTHVVFVPTVYTSVQVYLMGATCFDVTYNGCLGSLYVIE